MSKKKAAPSVSEPEPEAAPEPSVRPDDIVQVDDRSLGVRGLFTVREVVDDGVLIFSADAPTQVMRVHPSTIVGIYRAV